MGATLRQHFKLVEEESENIAQAGSILQTKASKLGDMNRYMKEAKNASLEAKKYFTDMRQAIKSLENDPKKVEARCPLPPVVIACVQPSWTERRDRNDYRTFL